MAIDRDRFDTRRDMEVGSLLLPLLGVAAIFLLMLFVFYPRTTVITTDAPRPAIQERTVTPSTTPITVPTTPVAPKQP